MKDEINSYNIKNPDGVSKGGAFEKKVSFTNDNPRFIKEDSASSHIEWKNDISETDNDFTKSSSSSLSTVPSVSTVSATMSGGVNALFGVVAASVAAGVVVVAAVVSAIVMNITLFFASMNTLVFKIDMQNAKEEDFQTPVIAVLSRQGETYYEQEVFKDSVYLVFNDLMPNEEYTLTVKNEEKVFFEQTCTTSDRQQVEYLYVSNEGGEFFAFVEEVGEPYTVTAQDRFGNVVFAAGEDGKSQEFIFTIENPNGEYYFTLAVGDKVLSFQMLYFEDYSSYSGEEW